MKKYEQKYRPADTIVSVTAKVLLMKLKHLLYAYKIQTFFAVLHHVFPEIEQTEIKTSACRKSATKIKIRRNNCRSI